MKLYYIPSACSLSSHIVAIELGLTIELVKMDPATKRTEHGEDYLAVNPKGRVPALRLDDGTVLTEGPAVVQYLADLKPDAQLAPANGSMARYRLQEMLGFINSELHQSYMPLFDPACSDDVRSSRMAYLQKQYGLLEAVLGRTPFLLGERFTVADAYLFVVTRWAEFVKLDLSAFPNLRTFQARIATRPAVQAAMRREQPASA
ncbi:glutathione S-transferase [Polaromonas sp. YR568]|uniref:glutathione transferase GstA n=1 Tax=Polaromonas sp. YR568 TaxID=1855301 RepID=UPI0008E684D1|nr:glutathione transferase GstA [Polaromonas sp. YR568]SFU85650.1 glutathione S-transferase [Polaromonas sp. YR568]